MKYVVISLVFMNCILMMIFYVLFVLMTFEFSKSNYLDNSFIIISDISENELSGKKNAFTYLTKEESEQICQTLIQLPIFKINPLNNSDCIVPLYDLKENYENRWYIYKTETIRISDRSEFGVISCIWETIVIHLGENENFEGYILFISTSNLEQYVSPRPMGVVMKFLTAKRIIQTNFQKFHFTTLKSKNDFVTNMSQLKQRFYYFQRGASLIYDLLHHQKSNVYELFLEKTKFTCLRESEMCFKIRLPYFLICLNYNISQDNDENVTLSIVQYHKEDSKLFIVHKIERKLHEKKIECSNEEKLIEDTIFNKADVESRNLDEEFKDTLSDITVWNEEESMKSKTTFWWYNFI